MNIEHGTRNDQVLLATLPIAFPPPETDHTYYGHGHKSKIENACIHSFRGFFAELLGCFSADSTLGRYSICCKKYKNKNDKILQ